MPVPRRANPAEPSPRGRPPKRTLRPRTKINAGYVYSDVAPLFQRLNELCAANQTDSWSKILMWVALLDERLQSAILFKTGPSRQALLESFVRDALAGRPEADRQLVLHFLTEHLFRDPADL